MLIAEMRMPIPNLKNMLYRIIAGTRCDFPSERRLATNFVTPAFIPKSVNSTRSVGMTKTRLYWPYSSGPKKRPMSIAEMARIMLASVAPENRKKPPRAEACVT